MTLEITFSISKQLLTVGYNSPGKPSEEITIRALSGGWDNHKPLPVGQWLIVENPTGNRNYFGLFYKDRQINDQFFDIDHWRDGIRFGYHETTEAGSHGCIMTSPPDRYSGNQAAEAREKWVRIQQLIRAVRPRKILRYKNNENPKINNTSSYAVSSYGYMQVIK